MKRVLISATALAVSALIIWIGTQGAAQHSTPTPEDKIMATLPQSASTSSSGNASLVTYSVLKDTGLVTVMYVNETGGEDNLKVSAPWSKSVRLSPQHFAYISAQRESGEDGEVTVVIERAGYRQKTSTSRGSYAVASVSAAYSE
jgi:hypothetical protein